MYPTLQQRAAFISNACDYVKGQIKSSTRNKDERNVRLITIVSFSFVNIDLRDAFRDEFPRARWILVDTDARTSEGRISAREGHFYDDAPSDEGDDGGGGGARGGDANGGSDDGSEWEFRPVDFPHVILDGREPVEFNANRIERCIERRMSGEEGRGRPGSSPEVE